MIIWGGFGSLGASGNGPVNTGGNYIPSTDSWTATTTNSAPSARYGHTAVWTGNAMIVFGGYSFATFTALNDGGRYNPLTDSWTNITTTGAPAARYYHTAVWTGNEMIVWGGGGAGYLNDGGRYNPVSNGWTAVTGTGAPAGRSSHTAVWTGNEMIVWGGYNGSYLNDGGRYNPVSNGWTAITSTGAPSMRNGHTAVWTGSKMIVWGGNNGSVPLNDGGIYDPVSNTWTPVSTIGAPSARYYHTAVWTGTEMIVWGGANGTSSLPNDGGRYNPATDTWTPLPSCPDGFPDYFDCRPTLFGTNISFSCSNFLAGWEPGEPSHFSGVFGGTNYVTAGQSLWYSWTAPFSGGVVITDNSTFPSPCLAVYTGNTFATFSRVASNSTFNAVCRVAFSAVAGTTYQIAVDAILPSGSFYIGNHSFNGNLTLTPAPPNDLFTNSTPISGPLFETYGSVIGASREPGEPAHTNSVDVAAWPQTLWWSWTAPNNLGVSAIPVKLIAQGLQYQPNIGVYTGTSISNLTSVASTVQGPFNTRLMDFMALPGATYRIALGGNEDYPTLASTNLGNYYLRVNVHALVLSLANLNATTNANGSVDFGVDLQVTNYGSASSSALRVLVTANSSQSLSPDAGFTPDNQTLLLTVSLPALDPGQGTMWHIGAEVPERGHNPTNITIFADYAQLQEQVDTNWFTLDQVFILADEKSQLYSGGGVVLLDPGLTGSAFNPLTGVNVLGPTTIPEGSTAAYFGRARYASGDQFDFSNTVWTATLFSITNGLFTTGSVTSNTPVTLDAKYASDAFTYDTPTNILILNLPPPTLANLLRLPDRNFQLSLQGVPGRQHVIEAATNLNAPVTWTSLMTNAAGQDGSLIFTDSTATNFSRRFYRAREN